MGFKYNENHVGIRGGRGKRPVSLWLVSVYLVLAGLGALVFSWSDPFATGMSKFLGLLSALVQGGSGLLLLAGSVRGRQLYLYALPVVIVLQALYAGTIIGFTDDDYPFMVIGPFVIFGIVAYFLSRRSVREWLLKR